MGKIDFWRSGRSGEAALAPPAANDPEEALLLMRSFEESGQGWFWSTDASGRVTYLSRGLLQALGAARGGLAGSSFTDLFVPADNDRSGRRGLPFLLAKQSGFEKVVVRAAALDEDLYWSVSGWPQFDREGRFGGFRGSALDVTEERKSSRHASRLAKYDALTGLANRRSMSDSLDAALAGGRARRCTVMLVDLDRFKQVNDTLGHPAGDALLKQVAERLLAIVPDREQVFRLGGDEFQILLPGREDRGFVGDLATQVIAALSRPYSINGHSCVIGASIGIAIAPADGSTAEELIRNADLALYASKGGGRGRFRFFSHELLRAAADKRILENELRDALAKEQIHVEYQPIVESKTNLVKGVEALIRWQHPERGPIAPSLFIPIAEEVGLIGSLGEWVLRKACSDAAAWPSEIRVAVNVSPLQFADESLIDTVRSALADSALAPGRLELEITEGVFIAESAETDTMFAKLKEIGVRLALDDFGTGYSSLSYLRTAPFDKIKIDQTFVRAATLPGSRNGAIIAAIVALAEALGMETTAEGIEFMDQLHLIRGLGVSHVQGYVYSKPVNGAEATSRIAAGAWQIQPSGPARQRSERQTIFRKVGVMHGSCYKPALIRNLSDSGALVQGLNEAQRGDLCIIDFGDGQLSFARVTRAAGHLKGIAFERPLVNDGNGGLCTPHRVSPYLLASMGVPSADKAGEPAPVPAKLLPLEELGRKLGLTLAQPRAADKADPDPQRAGEAAPDASQRVSDTRARHDRESGPSAADVARLVEAARTSHNRQLKHVVCLLILSGARPGELLRARWPQIDFDNAVWHIPVGGGRTRDVTLTPSTLDLLHRLPRWDECAHVIANPVTRKPYRSLARSWEAAKAKAGLPYLELEDLRHCHVGPEEWPDLLGGALEETSADRPAPAAAPDRGEPGEAFPNSAWLLRQTDADPPKTAEI